MSKLVSRFQPAETAPAQRKHASTPLMLAVMLPIAALVVTVDRVTKNLAESNLSRVPGASVDVIDGWLRFSLSHNTGAAFGVLQNQSILYAIIALVVVVVSVGYYRYLPRNNWLLTVCLGMQLGGAVGNLIDRIQHVYVVDFIDVGIGAARWPWFNVADSCIVVGIIALAGYLILHPEAQRA
ncbi:MAG TPA: signal peptidase II [Chloroflexota bacterium]|jgi:signal peptidase II|nr:signal peptidase II [Chloroflexota bacterium]